MSDDFEIAVGSEGDFVVLKVAKVNKKNVDILAVVPLAVKNALDISEAMAKRAFECRGEVPVAGHALKAELMERHRTTLTNRVALMFNSLREQKTITNRKLAKEVVEACLREVF